MKVWIGGLIGGGIIVVIVLVVYFGSNVSGEAEKTEETACNFTHTSGCSLECISDNDCMVAGNSCSCLNKDVGFSTCLEFSNDGISCRSGVACLTIAECKCVNNKCGLVSQEVLEDPAEECVRLGLEWRVFNNGCVDSCFAERTPSVSCTLALEYGCDCGPDKCWNGVTCENN